MILRITLYLISIIWLGLFTYIGIDIYKETPKIIERDKAFVAKELAPKIEFVEKFKESNGRLPSIQEFNDLIHIDPNEFEGYIRNADQIPNEIRDEVSEIDWSKNYVIAAWRGEWFEFYISDGKRYVTNDFDYSDAIRNLLMTILIGLIPILGLLIYHLKLKKSMVETRTINI